MRIGCDLPQLFDPGLRAWYMCGSMGDKPAKAFSHRELVRLVPNRLEDPTMQRRDFLTTMLAGTALLRPRSAAAQESAREVFLERAAAGTPHKGKVLLAVQAHSDDIPLTAAGTVAKLVKEGYTGYLVRATNDDMGDAPGLGTPGTIGQNVLGNERDNDEVARVLGLKRVFNLNYGNHRMGDVSQNELQCRLIFLIRLLKVDTVVCWDPWAHDEENPDHDDDRPRRGSGVLDGRPGLTIIRSSSRPDSSRTRSRRSTTTRGGRRSPASWTSAAVVDTKDRGQPRQPGQGTGRSSRVEAPGRAGQKEPAAAAPGRRRRHRRPQLHQGVRPGPQPGAGPQVRRGICRGVPLHRPGTSPPVEDYIRKHAVPVK